MNHLISPCFKLSTTILMSTINHFYCRTKQTFHHVVVRYCPLEDRIKRLHLIPQPVVICAIWKGIFNYARGTGCPLDGGKSLLCPRGNVLTLIKLDWSFFFARLEGLLGWVSLTTDDKIRIKFFHSGFAAWTSAGPSRRKRARVIKSISFEFLPLWRTVVKSYLCQRLFFCCCLFHSNFKRKKRNSQSC